MVTGIATDIATGIVIEIATEIETDSLAHLRIASSRSLVSLKGVPPDEHDGAFVARLR